MTGSSARSLRIPEESHARKCLRVDRVLIPKTSSIVKASWYVTDDTHHDFNVSYVTDEIKRFSQRYADRMEEYPNILATKLMKEVKTTRRSKRTTSRLMYVIVL